MNPHSHPLHLKVLGLARDHKRVESEIIEALQVVDECELFRKFDCSSLTAYAVRYLGLADEIIGPLITVARKSKAVPEIKRALDEGRVTVSMVKRVTSVITQENARAWIEKTEILTQKELQKEVARVNPQAEKKERAKYVSENRLELKLNLSEDSFKKFKRVQDLESQRIRESSSMEMTLEVLVELYLEKYDPVRKAKRAQDREVRKSRSSRRVDQEKVTEFTTALESAKPLMQTVLPTQSTPPQPPQQISSPQPTHTPKPLSPRRKALPAALQHAIHARDQGQCVQRDEKGRRCPNQRWTEIHHLIEVAQGGPDTLENLVTLCSGHHRNRHLDSPHQKMTKPDFHADLFF